MNSQDRVTSNPFNEENASQNSTYREIVFPDMVAVLTIEQLNRTLKQWNIKTIKH